VLCCGPLSSDFGLLSFDALFFAMGHFEEVARLNRIVREVQRGLYVPIDATEEERKRQLLNIILLAATVVVSLILAMIVAAEAFGRGGREELALTRVIGLSAVLSNALVFAINRFSSRSARWIFVLVMFVAVALLGSPQDMVNGRSLIALAVPVAMSSILLHPYMSFVFAGLGCLIVVAAAHTLNTVVPVPGMIVLVVVALISALAIQALEQTLKNWRAANRNLALLNQASQALSSTLDLDKVLVTVLDEVRRLFGVVASSVWLTDLETGEVVCWQATGPQHEIVCGWRLSPGEGIAGWVVDHGQSLIVPDTWADERHVEEVNQQTGLGLRSIVAVPLRARQDIIGVLQVVDEEVDRFKPADLELLEPLAATAAIAIENARLYAEEIHRAAALARALEQQRELDRLKNEFLQNISHELRTPLALIMGYAELLNSGELGELDADQQGPVAVITRRVRILSKMVNDLIAILTVEAHELSKEPVDLVGMIHAMVSDFRAAAAEAELLLTAEIAAEVPQVSGDPDQLRRVLDNLLGNAMKFTPAGGSIKIRLWQNGDASKQDVVLEVTDTGIGIPPNQLDRIFDRFYQVDGSSKRRYGGVGLGLALVKEIVEAHKGRVVVESVVNEGSTFRVTLPVAA
jgi:signal transduction histidine kinase